MHKLHSRKEFKSEAPHEGFILKKAYVARCQWLTPVIPVTWDAEIRVLWFKDILGKEFVRLHL
jgi:hypothetical protein